MIKIERHSWNGAFYQKLKAIIVETEEEALEVARREASLGIQCYVEPEPEEELLEGAPTRTEKHERG